MIEVKHLYKKFGEQTVLNDICCQFEPGKNNLIIGQSGSGKTVLLKCLIGLLTPEKGEVLYSGRNLLAMSAEQIKDMRKEIGVLFQGSALFDSMDVCENVRFPLRMFSNMTARERDRRASFCLERVNIQNSNHKFPSELSGGMQKRVAIARAIALNPKYLFCDEPNSGLDPQTSILIDQLINDITQEYNITTIINTHDMNSVLGIGDNITFLSNSRCEWSGHKETILDSKCEALRTFLSASTLLHQRMMDIDAKTK